MDAGGNFNNFGHGLDYPFCRWLFDLIGDWGKDTPSAKSLQDSVHPCYIQSPDCPVKDGSTTGGKDAAAGMTEQAKQTKSGGISRRTFLLGGAAAVGGAVLSDAFFLEPRLFQVEEVNLPVEKIVPGRELRIAHLSDMHIRTFNDYFRKVAIAANALSPDLILLTGDFLERSRNVRGVLSFLEQLRAPGGVFAVQGNWEYWARVEGENLRRHFAGVGVSLLINERRDLDLQGVPTSLLGLDYPSPADSLVHLQQQSDAARLNILLSHVPAFDHSQLTPGTDLILSGHTHGGQVRLPFLPPPILPRFSGEFYSGLFRVGAADTPLYVTRGIGTSILPVRFFCRPEITLFRLHAA
jgi:predicted MPP superfamily phosphohydrolase